MKFIKSEIEPILGWKKDQPCENKDGEGVSKQAEPGHDDHRHRHRGGKLERNHFWPKRFLSKVFSSLKIEREHTFAMWEWCGRVNNVSSDEREGYNMLKPKKFGGKTGKSWKK